MTVIETIGLSKFYGKHIGIKNVNFTVEQGDKFGFVGPNGAGKSTLIRSLLGMLIPSSGQIKLMGKEMPQFGPQVRQSIGYIPAEVRYYSSMTSRQLLMYSAGFYQNTDLSLIDELSDFFELKLDKKISELSTGNIKKTAIIQSLIHQPKLLIMDEPTSGLDPLIKHKFFDLLEEKNKSGMTIFFSSHILSEIQRLCNRTAVIRSGEIVAIEDVSSLLKNQVKQCRLIFKDRQGVGDLPASFRQASWQDDVLSFEFHGDINVLSNWIASQELLDISIEEPDLETIFMNYYER